LLLKALTLFVAVYEVTVIVAVTASTLVVPMSANGTVPENEPVTATPTAPVNTGVKVPASVPFAVQAGEGVMVLAMVVVLVMSATDETASVRVPPPVAVPVLVTAPEKAEKVPCAYMLVPAKEAAVIWFVPVVKPDAEIRTEVPAGPVEGVRVTVGATIVNEAACAAETESEICTE